ncbi:MAG: hypothetical protein K6G91_11125 [Kiritimatiellae bacterium]|nr:hypothetical protein [Kiritimatiellia bacterium]
METVVANFVSTLLSSVLVAFLLRGMFRRAVRIFLHSPAKTSERRGFSWCFMLFWLVLWGLVYCAQHSHVEGVKMAAGSILGFIILCGFTLYAIGNVVEFMEKKKRGEKQSLLRWVFAAIYFLFAFMVVALLIGVCCRFCIDLLLPSNASPSPCCHSAVVRRIARKSENLNCKDAQKGAAYKGSLYLYRHSQSPIAIHRRRLSFSALSDV